MMRILRVRPLLMMGLVSITMFAAACGDDNGTTPTTEPTSPSQATTTAPIATETPQATTEPTTSPGNGATDGDPEEGETLFSSQGCSSCHNTNSESRVGPGLAGISERGDEEYIRESITDPGAVVVEGYNNIMPDLGLEEEQVDHLVAYLQTLE